MTATQANARNARRAFARFAGENTSAMAADIGDVVIPAVSAQTGDTASERPSMAAFRLGSIPVIAQHWAGPAPAARLA